jgi:mycothiol synthase
VAGASAPVRRAVSGGAAAATVAGDGHNEPAFPAGVRPFRPGDESAILELGLASLDRGELDGVTRHWLTESAAQLLLEPGRTAVAEEAGRVVGWVTPQHDELSVDLPFRRRGHGSRLTVAGRIIAERAGLPHLRLWVPRRDGPQAFARAMGMRYHSSLWQLRLPPRALVDAPRFADDVRVRPLAPGVDEAALVDLANEAFRDHPSPLRLDLDQVRRVHARPDFDPTTILVVSPAAEPDRLVAFCRVARYEDDDGRPVGEVKLVGVLPAFRNRGLGRELVRWGVDAVRRRGAGDVYLAVEGENEGALHLYTTLGFRQHVEWPHWVLSVAARSDPG